MPVPSNRVRACILACVRSGTAHPHVKTFAFLVLALDAWYFYDSMEYLWDPAEHMELGGREEVIVRLRKQRGSYITGFGLFLCLIFNRLVQLQQQLYECRNVLKEHGLENAKPRASEEA